MEREDEWNERIGEKIFVCGRECERQWELGKLKVSKLGKNIGK